MNIVNSVCSFIFGCDLSLKQQSNRYRIIYNLLLTILIAEYVILHAISSDILGPPPKEEYIAIDSRGLIDIIDSEYAIFNLGRDTLTLFTAEIKESNQEIRLEARRATASLWEANAQLSNYENSRILPIIQQVKKGAYSKSSNQWDRLVIDLSNNSRKLIDKEGARFDESIDTLISLKESATLNYNNLAPPSILARFFWLQGPLIFLEVIFWSMFGILTNLSIKTTQFIVQGNYLPVEGLVGASKFFYGPIVSLVVVMVVLTGFFDFGEYNILSWSIPIVAFFLGFNVRKSVGLLDKFSKAFMSSAEESIDAGPSAINKRRAEMYKQIMSVHSVRNVKQLKNTLKSGFKIAVETEIAERELRQ